MTAVAAPARPRLSRRRRLLFALVPLCGLLLVGEVITRLVRGPTYFGSFRQLRTDMMKRNYPAERDPLLAYVPLPEFQSRDNHWGTLVSIDADGMRRNGAAAAPTGPRVIAAVGDSFTFGDQVDDDATWPAQLEQQLGQPVKNGGVFGYSLAQSVLRAEQMLDKFSVATLIVSFIPDDLTRCELSRRYLPLPWFDLVDGGIELRNVPLPVVDGPPSATKYWKDLAGCSALLDAVLANTVRDWWHEDEKQAWIPHLQGRGPDIGKLLLDRIAAACRAHDTRLLVLLQGDVATDGATAVLDHARANGVRVLDLVSRFTELSKADSSLHDKWFAGHMTREGNAWVAREIVDALRTLR